MHNAKLLTLPINPHSCNRLKHFKKTAKANPCEVVQCHWELTGKRSSATAELAFGACGQVRPSAGGNGGRGARQSPAATAGALGQHSTCPHPGRGACGCCRQHPPPLHAALGHFSRPADPAAAFAPCQRPRRDPPALPPRSAAISGAPRLTPPHRAVPNRSSQCRLTPRSAAL